MRCCGIATVPYEANLNCLSQQPLDTLQMNVYAYKQGQGDSALHPVYPRWVMGLGEERIGWGA